MKVSIPIPRVMRRGATINELAVRNGGANVLHREDAYPRRWSVARIIEGRGGAFAVAPGRFPGWVTPTTEQRD